MILIFCPHCQEARSLSRKELRSCSCGQSWGKYLEDGSKAIINRIAVPIGIANDSLRRGIPERPTEGIGRIIDAVIFPYESQAFEITEEELL